MGMSRPDGEAARGKKGIPDPYYYIREREIRDFVEGSFCSWRDF